MKKENELIYLKNQKQILSIPLENLLYIQTAKSNDSRLVHRLEFVTRNGNYLDYGSLKNFDSEKYPVLFRAHQSVLVNLKQVELIDKKEKRLYFFDGNDKNCQYSRRRLKNLTTCWQKMTK